MTDEDTVTRRRALTELDRTMLVEAGAGAGKTSVLAGRAVALLAAGLRAPREIAAITFTEAGAGELAARVRSFVDDLGAEKVPPDLAPAFPDGPTEAQRAALAAARHHVDEMTCGTIHAFCRVLLADATVEAGVDPGATVAERETSDALLEAALRGHLRERLSSDVAPDDVLVAAMSAAPDRIVDTLRTIVGRLRARPDLLAPDCGSGGPAALRERVRAFRAFLDGTGNGEPLAEAFAAALEEQVADLADEFPDDARSLVRLARMVPPERCATAEGHFRAYRAKSRWRTAAPPASADRLCAEATLLYDACREAHADAVAWAGGRVLASLFREAEAVLARYAAEKARRGALDFDDLLLATRDVLARHADVRERLASRFPAVLVDEFQDTDPLQCEILWRLSAPPEDSDAGAGWRASVPRPGSLFLVGDPKQAIFRFRDADVTTYVTARASLLRSDPSCVVRATRNFRSGRRILEFVNERFAGPLGAPGQPGFAPLSCGFEDEGARAMALDVSPPARDAAAVRDAEAEAVAAACEALVGRHPVPCATGTRPCEAGDVALLAPSGTDLWRYEAALRRRGIACVSNAGRAFFGRQEVQDMVALCRTLADARDTLALGALLRGPLVGLTEEALLDASLEVPCDGGETPRLDLRTDPERLSSALLRETMALLRALAGRAGRTTPHAVLCEAVDGLRIRAVLAGRGRDAPQALANLDLFLEVSRAYDARGFAAFATDMARAWEDGAPMPEGTSDATGAVRLLTMHGAKGLQWPIVIPINLATRYARRLASAVDLASHALHVPPFDGFLPGAATAVRKEEEELERERHRVLYVAATRARHLLLVPRLPFAVPKAWTSLLGPLHALPAWRPPSLTPAAPRPAEREDRTPDAAAFRAQEEAIRFRALRLERVTPHRARASALEAAPFGPRPGGETDAGGRLRGSVMHDLIESVLTGEVRECDEALVDRARRVAADLCVASFNAEEAAGLALRALAAVAEVRRRYELLPEYPIASSRRAGNTEVVTSGIADAVALDGNGRAALVVEWKSDVAPVPATVARYAAQVRAYLDATGAPEGLVVFAASGRTLRVAADASAPPAGAASRYPVLPAHVPGAPS